MRPLYLPKCLVPIWSDKAAPAERCPAVKQLYLKLRGDLTCPPVISVVIPAYNEEESLLKTLWSLAANLTRLPTEILVVNNNSTDATAALAEACGVVVLHQPVQGITPTRNAGLEAAGGQYILNADADSLYPPHWVELMTAPLMEGGQTGLTYGRFSFLPVGKTGRNTYWFYEYGADVMRYLNRYLKDEAVNVYGFNSGFRKADGMAVGRFQHPEGTNEDGWLALKLRTAGYGNLYEVHDTRALVWTTDRRIQIDGGIQKATVRRFRRMFLGGPR